MGRYKDEDIRKFLKITCKLKLIILEYRQWQLLLV